MNKRQTAQALRHITESLRAEALVFAADPADIEAAVEAALSQLESLADTLDPTGREALDAYVVEAPRDHRDD